MHNGRVEILMSVCLCVQCIPSSLSADDFTLQLLGHLNTCDAPAKLKILTALQVLHSQGLLQNTDKLYQGLMDLVPSFVRPHMVLCVQVQDSHCAFQGVYSEFVSNCAVCVLVSCATDGTHRNVELVAVS